MSLMTGLRFARDSDRRIESEECRHVWGVLETARSGLVQ